MISNPILQNLTVIVNQGADVTIANSDPPSAPSQVRSFWFNRVASKLFLAIATNSISDWIVLGASPEWVDIENKPETFPSTWEQVAGKPDLTPDIAAILNKIVVADGQVLTTDDNVIFED